MAAWWSDLGSATQAFYAAALFFSALFLWQLIAALMGLGGGEDFDVDAGDDADMDADVAAGEHPEFEHGADVDGTATMASFKLLSFRSILAFLMMFSWAGALYTHGGTSMGRSLGYALVLGLLMMAVVALLLFGLRRLAESGTPRIDTAVGTDGTVYLDIPADGMGEARVRVSGVLSHVRARGVGGQELKAGTPVRVTRVLGPRTIEVEPL
jgi:membrane protein implicated in regulation of membrane protease activity